MLPVTLISLAAIPGVNYFSALLANRRLLILDKATSNVDSCTEMQLQKAMDKLVGVRTRQIQRKLRRVANLPEEQAASIFQAEETAALPEE